VVPADHQQRPASSRLDPSCLFGRGSIWAVKMNRMMFMACCYNDPDMLIDPDTVYPIRPECREDAAKTRFKPRVIDSFYPFLILRFNLIPRPLCPRPHFDSAHLALDWI
jgi:hypothetical protein